MITITKVGSLVKIDGIEGHDNVYESISNFQGARMSTDGTQLSLQIGEVNIGFKDLSNFTIGGTVPTNAATVKTALEAVFPSAAPGTALPTETVATYAAMTASITSDPTTKRDFFVTADETNGGVVTSYRYNGTSINKNNSNNFETVYVESYGSDTNGKLGDKDNPFQTINAAIAALPSTGGIVKIGRGDFTVPTSLKVNLVLIGSGKPVPNWTLTHNPNSSTVQTTYTAPTKLTGGTVLKGSLRNTQYNNIVLKDLGVDAGSDWCTAYNSGTASDAITFGAPDNTAQSNHPQLYGIGAFNISALCQSSTASQHAMLFENVYAFQGENLSTYFGTHGFAIKSIGGQVNGIDAHGHFSNGVIIKGDDYAYSTGVRLNNIYITSIAAFDGGGLRFTGLNSTLRYPAASNFFIENTRFGFVAETTVDGMSLTNGTVYNVSGVGVNIPNTCTNYVLNNINQKIGVTGYVIAATGSDLSILSNCKAESNTGEGFSINATTASILTNNLSAISNTGAGFSLTGNIYGNNNQNIGSAATVGTFITENYIKGAHLIPNGATNTYNLGSSSVAFAIAYAVNFLSNNNAFFGTTLAARDVNIMQTTSKFIAKFFATTGNLHIQDNGTFTDIPSARFAVNSTTQGGMFPRMTTTQKNAIASPSEGLIVYDSTLHKLCVRTASAWETITSA